MTLVASSNTPGDGSISSSSSFLNSSQWRDGDRMLHDESSDASSSYYFLQQFGSFSTLEEDELEELRRRRKQSGDWSNSQPSSASGRSLMDYEDPDDYVPENNSDSSESSSDGSDSDPLADLVVGENDSESSSEDDESLSRIGIQPLGSYSFDTIMEMDSKEEEENGKKVETSEKQKTSSQPSMTRSRSSTRSIKSQDAYWNNNSTSNHNNDTTTTTEEYSFFSEGSEPPATLWELLRLQTLLGSCTQPEMGDSFDDMDEKMAYGKASKKSKAKATVSSKKNKEQDSMKQGDSWVFFDQMTRCGFPSSEHDPTSRHKQKEEDTIIESSPSRPSKQELNQQLMGEVYYPQDSDDDDNEKKVDSLGIAGSAVEVAVTKTRAKMKSLLGKLKRQTSDHVRSVKLAASFTEDGGSIVNGAEAKYEKFVEEQQQEKQEYPEDELQATKPAATTTTATSKSVSSPPPPPAAEEGWLCQFNEPFEFGGCYDDSACGIHPPKHPLEEFDDFGVDPSIQRNNHTSWAQFDRPFPRGAPIAAASKNKALNTSYNSTGTATTAESTQASSPERHRGGGGSYYDKNRDKEDSKNSFPIFDEHYGGKGYHHTNNKTYDSEYGRDNQNKAPSRYSLYQQKHKKSQRRLSNGLKKMKRRFSKTKAEI